MKVALVGAIDRYNYGDVLFPIIVEEALKKRISDIKFDYYGYKRTDLSRFDVYPTKEIKDIKNDDIDAIIVVGGEVLTSPWSLTYLFLFEDYRKANILSKIKKITREPIFGFWAKMKLGYTQRMPWIFEKKDYPNKKIIYNTVGGGAVFRVLEKKKKYFNKSLNQADFISVREESTKKNLNKIGVKSVLGYPDSAFLMSELFPKNSLEKLSSHNMKNIKDDYIVFQIGKKYGIGKEDTIFEKLKVFIEKTHLNVVLLPIGMVALHEDAIPLKKIYESFQDSNLANKVILINNNTIFDTMSIIANSKLFIGTSLHGNVTALSYGNPSIGLDSRVIKLNDLLKTYSIDQQAIGIDYEDMDVEMIKALDIDRQDLKRNSERINELVNENFDLIADVLISK